MTQSIGYYTGYDPQNRTPEILDHIQQRWGSQLQGMTYEQKIVMRAAFTGFIAQKPVWDVEHNSITCIDACTESAGADWNIWDEDVELCQVIEACSQLHESDIEGLIEALTSQIRSKIYASRTEVWEVVTR